MLNKNWKNAMVIGAGISGIAAAEILKKKGFKIYISDKKNRHKIKNLPEGIIFVSEKKAKQIINSIDFFIKSPGIPYTNILLKKIIKLNKPILSEIDLSMAFCPSKNIIAITGTNGKTTTTILTYQIMKNFLSQKKAKAIICGNIGKPATKEVIKARNKDWIIMEISSYQLEDSHNFAPKISAILNITPDHIEHHITMKNYIKAKEKIFKNQSDTDFSIFNYDNRIVRNIAKYSPSKVLFFSSKRKGGKITAFWENGKIKINFHGKKYILNPPPLLGKHNIENSMAAALCAIAAGVDKNTIQKTFTNFRGVEHRIEEAGTIKGIRFINDSKATNVDSTLIALKSLGRKKNIWLILGGLDKGSPYKPLIPFIKKYVKTILTIGSAAKKIEKELKNSAEIIPAKNIANAVRIIYRKAKEKDIALLSPACASYDQFNNFEERGNKFKELVKKLQK